mmetsp:Transcript_29815/g.66865  ORF Transcript_29815/g.66865 Transcript_29815/m.66865 type:complete len:220 (+) Transcript_29815:528-1187(+)
MGASRGLLLPAPRPADGPRDRRQATQEGRRARHQRGLVARAVGSDGDARGPDGARGARSRGAFLQSGAGGAPRTVRRVRCAHRPGPVPAAPISERSHVRVLQACVHELDHGDGARRDRGSGRASQGAGGGARFSGDVPPAQAQAHGQVAAPAQGMSPRRLGLAAGPQSAQPRAERQRERGLVAALRLALPPLGKPPPFGAHPRPPWASPPGRPGGRPRK